MRSDTAQVRLCPSQRRRLHLDLELTFLLLSVTFADSNHLFYAYATFMLDKVRPSIRPSRNPNSCPDASPSFI